MKTVNVEWVLTCKVVVADALAKAGIPYRLSGDGKLCFVEIVDDLVGEFNGSMFILSVRRCANSVAISPRYWVTYCEAEFDQ